MSVGVSEASAGMPNRQVGLQARSATGLTRTILAGACHAQGMAAPQMTIPIILVKPAQDATISRTQSTFPNCLSIIVNPR